MRGKRELILYFPLDEDGSSNFGNAKNVVSVVLVGQLQ